MSKPIKYTGSSNMLALASEVALKYIKAKTGRKINKNMFNHSTILCTLNDGSNIKIHTYETKTLIVIEVIEQSEE